MRRLVPTTYLRGLALLTLCTAILSGCSDDTTSGPEDTTTDEATVLSDVANKVILATYVDLDDKAGKLITAVSNFNTSATEANLTAARQAWRDARRPWEQSEAFLFGPVDTKGIDPGIDSWPVNKADLDAVLASDATLTKNYIDGLEGTLKGFHTIEYLLFGAGNAKTVASFTPREREYLVAVTESFKGSTAQLRSSWEPSGENFVAQLAGAGTSGSIYTSRKIAVQELVDGMAAICDEVANGKIGEPFTQQDRSLEESQFSDNSNADFQDNIRSVMNVYLGSYGTNQGKGLSTLVAAKKADLDAKVRAQITAAITAIGAMTPSFGDAIVNNKPKVEAAQEAVTTLRLTLEGEVLQTLTN